MTRRIGFFVPDKASLLGLDCAVDTLRVANRHLGRPFYEWCTIGQTNLQIKSSNGLKLTLDHLITDVLPPLDMLFVCATVDTSSYVEREVFAWLRRMAGRVTCLGGITSGALILARAGLMKGYTCTIHWEDADAIQREFPQVHLSNGLFVIDRDRMTSAGGLVTIDLFLHIIARDLGAATALSMTNAFHIDRMRGEGDVQSWSMRKSTQPRPQQILRAATLMEQNVEHPLTLGQIARELKTSVRQLHRVFRRHLQELPSDYYRAVRLAKAQKLLRSTNKSVLDISLACGFASQSAFSRSYLRFFGHSPGKERENRSQS